MKKLIETERLILREFELVDAKSMYALNADPQVMKYTGDKAFESPNAARAFLSGYSDYQRNGFGRWAVLLKPRQEFIGWCGLKLNEENLVDLGFRFFQDHWNKGYATEAAHASLKYGFDELDIREVIGRAAKANVASVRVLEKIGMKFWKEAPCLGIEEAVYYKINTP